MASRVARLIRVNDLEWTIKEALEAHAQLDELERIGVWDRPPWAQQIGEAFAVYDPEVIKKIAVRRILKAYKKHFESTQRVLKDAKDVCTLLIRTLDHTVAQEDAKKEPGEHAEV